MGGKLNKLVHGVTEAAKAADKAWKWLDEVDSEPRSRKRKARRKSTSPTTAVASSLVQSKELGIDRKMERIIQSIQDFTPIHRPSNERDYQTMLFTRLQQHYDNVAMGPKIGNNEIDATVGRIGIEVKTKLRKADADRLFGQIDAFLEHIDRVIVVLYQPNVQWQSYFKEKIARHSWQDRVRVISIAA